MPIDPNIIGNVMIPQAPNLPDVNAMMQTQQRGMESMIQMERQREADALSAQERETDAAAKALAPAIASAFSDPSDEGLDIALSMVPAQYQAVAMAQIDRLRAVPDLNRRKDIIRAGLAQDDYGRAILAQLEPTANMRLQADTAAQAQALRMRELQLQERQAAAEAAGGGKVVQWITNDAGDVTGLDAQGNVVVTQPGIGKKTAQTATPAASQGVVNLVAAKKADDTLIKIAAAYQKLKDLRAITSTEQTAGQNLEATFSALTGSTLGAAVGSEAQTQRQIIRNLRQALLNDIKAATGMSSKAIDSNVELQAFLSSLGDPESQSFEAAMATISELSAKYAAGSLANMFQDIGKGKTDAQTAPSGTRVIRYDSAGNRIQ